MALIRTRHIQLGIDIAMYCLGILAGIALAKLGAFEVFKLFNIIGLTFDIFGVLILSYVIISSLRIKEFVAGWGAATAISILGFIPIGLFTGALISSVFLGHTEVDKLFEYFLPITVYALLSAFFVEDAVLLPKLKIFRDTDTRVKVLGGFFLLSGLGIQLYAAVLDLVGS